MLPVSANDATHIVVFIAFLAFVLTMVEYSAKSPSIVEFRDAAPFNRLRYVSLFATVFFLSMIIRDASDPTLFSGALSALGTVIGNGIDFPYSPVRLVVLALPENAAPETVAAVRQTAGISYMIFLISMTFFLVLVRILDWPVRPGKAFNVWQNLPIFDPTAGGDVVERLHRDARVNIALGFLLPFAIPAVVKLAADLIDPISLEHPQTLVWTMSAWAFLSLSIMMRGIALGKIAEMIEDKRRAYAKEQGMQPA